MVKQNNPPLLLRRLPPLRRLPLLLPRLLKRLLLRPLTLLSLLKALLLPLTLPSLLMHRLLLLLPLNNFWWRSKKAGLRAGFFTSA